MLVLTKRLLAALTLVGGILAGATAVTPAVAHASALAAVRTAPFRTLPAALAQVAATEIGQIVSIVAADIDSDGDLDVVASDSSLQLHVWVNDGAGHFTLRTPRRSSGLQPTPPAPSVDDQSGGIVSFTQINPPTLGPGPRTAIGVLPVVAPTRMPAALALSAGDRLTRTPRAPPVATLT